MHWLLGNPNIPVLFHSVHLFSQSLRNENSFAKRKLTLNESIKHFKEAVELDPRDDLTHLFCALEYAEGRTHFGLYLSMFCFSS